MYDEAIDVTDADEVQSTSSKSRDSFDGNIYDEKSDSGPRPRSARRSGRPGSKTLRKIPANPVPMRQTPALIDSETSDNSEEEDDDDAQPILFEGSYDPKEYEHLMVSPEIKELFEYITFYTPQSIQLDYKLLPFVPDYIPAVGDIDGFLKVPRPDGVNDKLGLTVLDEPCATQSEPAVMQLHLRASTKQSSEKPVIVKQIDDPQNNPKAIDRWINDIRELHKNKPPQTVQYSRKMPDIDSLMQEWPPEFEQKLNEVGLPLQDLDTDLLSYVDVICVLFDIPVHESRIESLHVLFSLYSAIKNYGKEDEQTIDNILELSGSNSNEQT